MVTWADLAAGSADVAEAGRRLLFRGETGEALLATVRNDQPPRIHPIWVSIVDGRLYAFILASAKRGDLVGDGRYAMHSHIDPASPSEFSIRGHARLVTDAGERSALGAGWYFEVDDTYELFEFAIEAATLGVRDTADEWPPRYTSWKAGGQR